jgi:hypothetical protein
MPTAGGVLQADVYQMNIKEVWFVDKNDHKVSYAVGSARDKEVCAVLRRSLPQYRI